MSVEAEGYQYNEEYARSLSALRGLGAVAMRGDLGEVRATSEYELAYRDFLCSIEEMLKTDPEFRHRLDVDSPHSFDVVDGRAVNRAGVPMVEVIENGMKVAFKAAQTDPRMWAQYARDKNDRDNAYKVDALQPGQSLVALSMDPKHELQQDRKFWEGKGYREGIAYIQWYSKPSASNVITGALSVDMSDEAAWRRLFAQLGQPVPADVTPNEWLTQSIELQATPEQTQHYVKSLRNEYYCMRGAEQRRFSVTEYVQKHETLLKQQFDMYYPALSQAIISGQTTPAVAGFARSLLANARDLDRAKRNQLQHLVSSGQFDDTAGRLLDGALSYAVVEDLRKGLGTLVQDQPFGLPQYVGPLNPGLPPAILYEHMNERLADNVQTGAVAGRRYGGCPGEFNPNDSRETNSNEATEGGNPQGTYGGRESASSTESSSEACVYEHENCYCCSYNYDGTPSATKIKVKAFSKNGKATCLRTGCGAWISKNGKDEGGIWKRAQQLLEDQKLADVEVEPEPVAELEAA